MKAFLMKFWGLVAAVMLLAACGGSGGPVGGETEPPPATGPVPASLTLFSDLGSLRSSGADIANLTAVVKDANNVVISGVTVNFAADSGSLSVTQPTTDTTGQAKATLGTPGNPANRTINVTATVAGTTITQSLTISVTGTTLTISGPTSMASGDTQPITLNLRDSDGNGLGSQTITLTSALNNTFSNATPITSGSGAATVNYTAGAGGSETITATAISGSVVAALQFTVSTEVFTLTKQTPAGDITLGADGTIRLFYGNPSAVANASVTISTTRGTLNGSGLNTQVLTTNASGQIDFTVQSNNAGPAVISATTTAGLSSQLTVEFIATTPAAIAVSASPTTIAPNGQESVINAVVRDANGNLVKGRTVSFSLIDVSGGSLSSASAITDSNGLASTVYRSGTSTSALNGVQVTATVLGTTVTGASTLTVARSPLFISIGTGNSIQEPNDTIYAKNFAVSVTDASGAGVANQQLSVSVTPLLPSEGSGIAYYKGYRQWTGTFWGTVVTASCQNEDLNLNGILDVPPDNDLNNNGMLEPGNKVTLGSGSVTTDSTGFATVTLRYAQEYAYYMNVIIRVSANVSGTEASTTQIWLLEGLAADFNKENTSPPGPVSFFGTSANCADTL